MLRMAVAAGVVALGDQLIPGSLVVFPVFGKTVDVDGACPVADNNTGKLFAVGT